MRIDVSVTVSLFLFLSGTPILADDGYLSPGEKKFLTWLLFFLIGVPVLRFFQLLISNPRKALRRARDDLAAIVSLPSSLFQKRRKSLRLVGSQFPALIFKTIDGLSLSLDSFRGRIVAVRWWGDHSTTVLEKHTHVYPDDENVVYLFAYTGGFSRKIVDTPPPSMEKAKTMIVNDMKDHLARLFDLKYGGDYVSALVVDPTGIVRTPPHDDTTGWEESYGFLHENEQKDKFLIEMLCRSTAKGHS
ncbi:MAG: hypothetical protein V3V99_01645 [candidate division Zixibacteria bacterium]